MPRRSPQQQPVPRSNGTTTSMIANHKKSYDGEKTKPFSLAAMLRSQQHKQIAALLGLGLFLLVVAWSSSRGGIDPSGHIGVGLRGGSNHHGYVVVIDAGSSGSRAHVFHHTNGVVDPKHESLKTKPGLSSYASDPSKAGTSLAEVVAFAKQHVPASAVSSTPLFLKATAGMRLLPLPQQEAVMDNVAQYLSGTGFQFSKDQVRVIDGMEEGLLGWMSVNYLNDSPGTWGVLEMGGASIQVTTKINEQRSHSDVPKEHQRSYQLPSESKPGRVYTHSFLGLGMESARRAVNELLETTTGATKDPCLQEGYPGAGDASDLFSGPSGKKLVPSGNYEECAKLIQTALFQKTADRCEHPKGCLFNGLYAPSFEGNFWAFENFYYTPSALGVEGVPGETTIAKLEAAAKANCGMAWDEMNASHPKDWQPKEINNKWCFGQTYIYQLLTEGLQFRKDQKITVSNDVHNQKNGEDYGIDWALGAALQAIAANPPTESS